ncbi:MAG TPA: hypothetical protein VLA96_07450 [Terriglobales bacterium]|nr:hypothetical protein [Terriglobales bacterium]
MDLFHTSRAALAALLLVLALPALAQQKPGEPPLWLDYDMEDIKEPKELKTLDVIEFLDGTLWEQIRQSFDFPRQYRYVTDQEKESYNVNSVDEVPDSSWFTNRNGRRAMSLDEIRRGPNRGTGPAPGKLLVTKGKAAGVGSGFWIKDERGDSYLLKFDPPDFPEVATAAEVISTKLFYAIGYNVPENYLFYFRPEQLQLAPDAKLTMRGKKRAFKQEDLDRILALLPRRPDGAYRAVASKMLPGKPKGGFRFTGVREDDPNDIIPHQHRRDVRALRIFAAWLNDYDIHTANTLDMFVEEGGRHFIRHYVFDFGSTLGSAGNTIKPQWAGFENRFDLKEAGKGLATLGAYQPPSTQHPIPVEFPSVGRYSADGFDPLAWKPTFPVIAFENLTLRDARWAARIVGSFTDEQIRAAVATGELSDPAAAEYLARQIMARRDKTVLRLLRPLVVASEPNP